MRRVDACTPMFLKCGDIFDIEIVSAGNKGLSPGVVAIEYIDWLLAYRLS